MVIMSDVFKCVRRLHNHKSLFINLFNVSFLKATFAVKHRLNNEIITAVLTSIKLKQL